MDSITQFALGASIGVAVMGRRTPPWRAALWGGLCGTLPDLDVLIDHGDPIRNMTLHRTESHSLFYLTLAAPALAWVISAIEGRGQFRRWWLCVWLALITHPLLDLLTVYGTQLGLPFTDTPFFTGSVFVIDPVVTLALVGGLALALVRGPPGWRANLIGLAIATAYLAWGLVAQHQAREAAISSLARAGIKTERLLVSPTAFNTLLWRIVVMTPEAGWHEGYYSLLDPPGSISFQRRDSDIAARHRHAGDWHLERLAWFSHGFFDVAETGQGLRVRDLRMGNGDDYTFTFILRDPGPAPGSGASTQPAAPAVKGGNAPGETGAVIQQAYDVDLGQAVSWLWRRMLGEPLPLPDLGRTAPAGR